MGNVRDWIDFLFKTVIAAAVAYGGWYISVQKQNADVQHTQDLQQNDDIRFIVEMVTSPDQARRTMGVAVLTAYADSKPPRVPRQLADAIGAYSVVTKTLTDSRLDNEVIRQVQKAAIRVYIQYQHVEDKDSMEAIRQKMTGGSVAGTAVIVPPTENVKSVINAPVLKCFRKTECEEFGQLLVDQLKSSGAPVATTLQFTAGFENSNTIRPNHFEAWFGSRQ